MLIFLTLQWFNWRSFISYTGNATCLSEIKICYQTGMLTESPWYIPWGKFNKGEAHAGRPEVWWHQRSFWGIVCSQESMEERDPPWFWNLGQTSISDLTKRYYVPQILKEKKEGMSFQPPINHGPLLLLSGVRSNCWNFVSMLTWTMKCARGNLLKTMTNIQFKSSEDFCCYLN